ncbi:hypothetical protein LOK49_LG07G02919 [Camellia lanceoleosa]|uniref:Uncharacterized protein n=1 Tax=Camellia lanceoleosa TaxID=1840588 RepID=A0ACC0H4X5_9ERIC|nr:hypothetical protein LOK49_LG07G02919 [Camellia lanceoleosa]
MALPRSMISLLLLLFIPCFASKSIGYEPQEEKKEEFSEELLLKPLPDRKELVQSGPSYQSNEISEEVGVESGPSDEDNDKCELMSSSIQSGGSSEGNKSGKKSGVPSVIDHFSIADDLFYYI